jgi:hypothetical protein
VVTESGDGRHWWEVISGIVGTDSGAEPVPECSTSLGRMYSHHLLDLIAVLSVIVGKSNFILDCVCTQ